MKLLTDFILIGGIFITVPILYFLKKSKNKDLSQNILISIFILFLGVIINTYSDLHEIISLFIITFNITDLAPWIIGPMLFFYVKLR